MEIHHGGEPIQYDLLIVDGETERKKISSEESKKKERAYLLNQQKIIRVHF